MPGIPTKSHGKTQWTCDVTLPGMLHARWWASHVSSTLIPSARSTKSNTRPRKSSPRQSRRRPFPNEWEAIRGANSVAAITNDRMDGSRQRQPHQSHSRLQMGRPSQAKAIRRSECRLCRAAQNHIATYELPYRPARTDRALPRLADVRSDAVSSVWTIRRSLQACARQIANTLSIPTDKVVVRWARPLRSVRAHLLWRRWRRSRRRDPAPNLRASPCACSGTLQEDLAWSSVSPGYVASISKLRLTERPRNRLSQRSYTPQQNDAGCWRSPRRMPCCFETGQLGCHRIAFLSMVVRQDSNQAG